MTTEQLTLYAEIFDDIKDMVAKKMDRYPIESWSAMIVGLLHTTTILGCVIEGVSQQDAGDETSRIARDLEFYLKTEVDKIKQMIN